MPSNDPPRVPTPEGLREVKAGELPLFVRRFVRSGDRCFKLGESQDAPLLVRSNERRRGDLIHARLLLANRPKQGAGSARWFVRAQLAGSPTPSNIVIEGEAIARYFYGFKRELGSTLYSVLGVPQDSSPTTLRLAWRMRTAEATLTHDQSLRARCERAFNLLTNHNLRAFYDAFLTDDTAMLPFPYGGQGDVLVTGNLSKDASTFFANAILAYKPTITRERLRIRLRSFEFLPDRLALLDPRRKLEVWLDSGLLDGFHWDTSWNNWKHWLRSTVEVDATLVSSAQYRFVKGEWTVRSWWTALPSRLALNLPDNLEADVERARSIHALLGRYSALVNRVREQAQRQPIESSIVQSWLDQLGAPLALRPEYLCWKPDYEEYYFAQLRKRATAWFLFREEFLFVLPGAIVSEVPMPGHATYVFASPSDREAFLRIYERTSRNEIRQNAGNAASKLGFVGRVVRGRKRKRWLAEVLKLAGEQVNYLDAVED